ncbi:MAG TPA: hypothetical protein VLK82_12305 [Candidatus Tectomicrobia bacterium]|nr:hypothetical protein [Candidatus Tectomicrobia bacterium]
METTRGIAFAALGVLMVSGALLLQNSLAEPANISYGVLQQFADGSIVEGSRAMLVRTDKGLTITIHTSGLPPGAAHTVWWAIYNHPEHCAAYPGPCTINDLFIEAVQGTSFNATGHVIGHNGVGHFAAYLAVGDKEDDAEADTPGNSFPLDLPGDAVGFLDARTAQIQLVVRSHGQPIPGQVKEQTSTYNGGGCDDLEGDPPVFDDTDPCNDEQFTTVFVP